MTQFFQAVIYGVDARTMCLGRMSHWRVRCCSILSPSGACLGDVGCLTNPMSHRPQTVASTANCFSLGDLHHRARALGTLFPSRGKFVSAFTELVELVKLRRVAAAPLAQR